MFFLSEESQGILKSDNCDNHQVTMSNMPNDDSNTSRISLYCFDTIDRRFCCRHQIPEMNSWSSGPKICNKIEELERENILLEISFFHITSHGAQISLNMFEVFKIKTKKAMSTVVALLFYIWNVFIPNAAKYMSKIISHVHKDQDNNKTLAELHLVTYKFEANYTSKHRKNNVIYVYGNFSLQW